MRTYCKDIFSEIGHSKDWVQMNQSYTQKSGSVRGMHFQKRPYSEIKLVRCVRGSVYDVIVDIRKDSKTFLKWFGTEISAENKKMMYVPEGFAHGFQTLSDDCELFKAYAYQVDKLFDKQSISHLLRLLPIKIDSKTMIDNQYRLRQEIEIGFIHDAVKNYYLLEAIKDELCHFSSTTCSILLFFLY